MEIIWNLIKKTFLVGICLIALLVWMSYKNQNTEQESSNQTVYEHRDLLVSSESDSINKFLNQLFEEINFDGEMYLANTNKTTGYYTFAYLDRNADTAITFYFGADEQFMAINMIYDKTSENSVRLVKKVFQYSKFNFSEEEISTINLIITSLDKVDAVEVGNYTISNFTSGNITMKPTVINSDSLSTE